MVGTTQECAGIYNKKYWIRPWTEQEPDACMLAWSMEPFVHLRPHTHNRSRIRTTPTEPRMMMPV